MTRFKLDENLPPELPALLRDHHQEPTTVWDQQMRGAPDGLLAEVCRREGRALVTLDIGFADVRTYPPSEFPGLVVLRLRKQSRAHVLSVLRRVLDLLATERLEGSLWVVDESAVRVHRQEKP